MTRLAAPSQHTRIRQVTQLTYTDVVTVKRRSPAKTSGGGTTETLAIHSSGPGRLAPMNADMEAVWASRLGTRRGWTITVEHFRDVMPNDQLVVGSRTFEVLGFDQDRSIPLSQRVLVKEVLG